MNCTRCNGSGFLNLDQLDGETDEDTILDWIRDHPDSDVQVCDCCGDGSRWYGEPGQHYGHADPVGCFGPYAYNGGFCECH